MYFYTTVCSILRPLGHLSNVKSNNVTNNVKSNLIRSYARWAARIPSEIVNEDELYETEDTTTVAEVSHKKVRKPKKKNIVKSVETNKKLFSVCSANDKTISSLLTQVKSRKRREKNAMITLEGHRLINDALDSGVELTALLFNDPTDLEKFKNLPETAKFYKVPYNTIKLWSSLTTPPGIMGIFKTPKIENPQNDDALPITIICDNVKEPGNLGSIIRVAAGIGCEQLILIKGCVDLWDPKVTRSACGAHFRLPIHAFPTWDEVPSLINENSDIIIADSTFGDEFVPKYSSEELKYSEGIFDINPEDLKSSISENKSDSMESEQSPKVLQKLLKNLMLKLPIVPYYALNYTKQNIVLLVSGETEGFSSDVYKLLSERHGVRINIPLNNGVDSLNAGVALGIITSEIKRQFIKQQNEL